MARAEKELLSLARRRGACEASRRTVNVCAFASTALSDPGIGTWDCGVQARSEMGKTTVAFLLKGATATQLQEVHPGPAMIVSPNPGRVQSSPILGRIGTCLTEKLLPQKPRVCFSLHLSRRHHTRPHVPKCPPLLSTSSNPRRASLTLSSRLTRSCQSTTSRSCKR